MDDPTNNDKKDLNKKEYKIQLNLDISEIKPFQYTSIFCVLKSSYVREDIL